MAKTKVTQCQQLPKWLLCRGRRQCMGQTYPYKIKLTLPKQKQVDIKKMDTWLKQLMYVVGQSSSVQEVPDHFNYQCMK